MRIKIDKDIPFPSYWHDKYPFEEMMVGDSFFVANPVAVGIRSIATDAQKKLSIKLAVRCVDGGVRIWRTK